MSTDWRDEYFQLIADCRRRENKISSWDADFLDSIEGRLYDNKPLTIKQVEVLDGI